MPGRRNSGPGRGGLRRPETPAAVSGQGADSARTDGGPSNPVVDLTGFDSQRMGQRQQLEQVASTGTGGPDNITPGRPSAPAGATSPASPNRDVFRPSEVPGPVTQGLHPTPAANAVRQNMPDDLDGVIRAMWRKSRHPDLLRLLESRRGL